MTQTGLAELIATKAHSGQVRWGGEPYITHPRRIASKLECEKYNEDFIATAWLHDVVEDTTVTLEELTNLGFSQIVIQAVYLLTKIDGMSYSDYIKRLVRSENVVAKTVKIEDIRDNLSDMNKNGSLKDKYELALYILENSFGGRSS